MRLPFPAAAGGVALDASARFDAGRLRLLAMTAEPARPAQGVAVQVAATRPGGWLAGAPEAGGGARVRWAQLGVTLTPGPAGSIAAEPSLTLHEAAAGELAADLGLHDSSLRPALDALLDALGSAAAGSPEAVLLALLDAAGVSAVAGATRRAATAGLDALSAAPLSTLRARRDALLATLAGAIGAPAGPLSLALDAVGLELGLDLPARTLRARSTRPLDLAGPLGASFDARFDPFALTVGFDLTLSAGPVALTHDSAAGTLTLAAPPWLAALVVRPAPSPAALGGALEAVVERLALSATLSALLGEHVAEGAVGALDALLSDPGAWLRSPGALGAAGGGLDGAKVLALLQDVALALDLDPAEGLGLPGGFVVTAQGTDPMRLTLQGSFGDADVGVTVTLGLVAAVERDGRVSPGGTVTLAVDLPDSTWGDVSVAFSADPGGVGLVVTPANAGPITLLPHVSGLAQLAQDATKLLPHLLQELVVRLRARAGPHDVLDAVLELAAALGIYADDAAGFEAPTRAAALLAMLEPGWLESRVADSSTLAGLIAALFGPPPKLKPPVGDVTRDGDLVRWSGPLPGGGTLTAEAGWNATGPQVLVTVASLDTGPLVIEEARLGFDGDLSGALRLRLDPGGELDFLAPVAELGIASGGLSAALLPLGSARRADLALALVPTPGLTFTGDGALGLLGAWIVPLLTRFLLPSFTSLLSEELWTGGPSAGEVLEGAKLIDGFPAAPVLRPHIPALGVVALGGLATLARGATIHIPPKLDVSAAVDGGRLGLRLSGEVELDGDDLGVSLRFGSARWLEDADAGVTLWLLAEDAAAMPPVKLDPELEVIGLGALLSGPQDSALIGQGPVKVGAAGGLLFFDLRFLENGQPRLTLSDWARAVEIDDAELAISSDDGDSFVQKLLPQGARRGLLGRRRAARRRRRAVRRRRRPDGWHRADLPARPRPRRHRLAARAVPRRPARQRAHVGYRDAVWQRLARPARDGRRARRAAGDVRARRHAVRLQGARRLRPLARRLGRARGRLPARRRGARPLRRRARALDRPEVRPDGDRDRHDASGPTARPASRCCC